MGGRDLRRTRARYIPAWVAIVALACAGAPAAYATNFTCSWNNGTANWATSADWSSCNGTFPDNVSGNTYDATISSGDPTLTTAVTIGSVVVNSPGQWDLAGPSGSATLTGTLANTGSVNLDFFGNQGGSSLSVGGTLTNTSSGTVQIGTSGGSLSATSTLSAAGLSNSGTIDLFGNASNPANQANLTVTGPASNSGTVNILSAGNLSVTGGGNTYAQTAGTTNILAGGTLSAPNINITGGTLQGNGTVAGNLNVSAAGTVQGDVPNTNTPATMTVNGNYNQTGGTLAALLQGTGAGQVSTINVGTGGVNLSGGVLQTNFAAGLIPAAGQTFNNVMTYAPGSLSGLFAALQNGNGSLSANPTYLKSRRRSDFRGKLQPLRW